MTRPPRSLSFWTLQSTGWCGLYVLAAVASLPHLRARGVWPGITVFVASLLVTSALLRPIYRRYWSPDRGWGASEGVSLVGSLVGSLAVASGPFRWFAHAPANDWSGWPLDFVECFVVLFLWSNLYFSVKQYLHVQAQRERAIVAESEARKAKLAALRYQLNPHFLFNALNGVSTLILEDEKLRANEMLIRICTLLRASIEEAGGVEVPLRDEIALAEQYLAIERARIGDRLLVETEVATDVGPALVPSMLLQPLLENAVRHGAAPSRGAVAIRLTARRTGDALHIAIENPTVPEDGASGSGHGIGLSNTRERLAALYGTRQDVAIDRSERTCRVTIRIPWRLGPQESPCGS